MKSDIKDRIKKLNQGQIPEGFKRIQGQIIPDSWNIYKLEELIASSDYGTSEQTNDTKGYPVLRMGNLVDGKISIENLVYVDLDRESFNNLKLEKGDLLFNRTNSYDLVGKVSLFDLDGDYTFASYLIRLKVIDSKVLPKYLNYYMNLESSQRQIKTFSTKGVQQVNVNITTLKKFFKVKLPSNIFEQQKIIDILSTWDKAIELKEKLIEQKKEQKKGLMQRLLTGKVRLPGFEGEWKKVPLERLCKKMKSGGTPKADNKEFYNGNIPFVKVNDITSSGKNLTKTEQYISVEGLNNSSAWLVPQNSILYSMYASVGFVSINRVEVATNQAIIALIPNKEVDLEYLYYALVDYKKEVNRFIEKGTQGNLNANLVKKFMINLPSLKEQKAIATILATIDKEIDLLEQELEALKQQKKGLMQLLLTGKVRVKC